MLQQVAPAPAGPVVTVVTVVMSYSGSGDVTAQVSTVTAVTGCNPGDFSGFPPGNLALIGRGACTLAQRAPGPAPERATRAAAAAGSTSTTTPWSDER